MAPTATQSVQRSRSQETSSSDRPTDLVYYLNEYAQANPCAAAMWCLGIGFVLGWKLRIW